MNHTAEDLLRVPASDVVLPGVALSGWLSKQSDWVKSWNDRWLVLWPVGQPTASQLSRGDSLGFHAAAEGGMTAHGFWLFLYDSPSSNRPRRVVLLQPGTFALAVNEEEDRVRKPNDAKHEKSPGSDSADGHPEKRTVLELSVRESLSSSLLPSRAQEHGATIIRLSCTSSKNLRMWARAISDIVAPVRRGRLDSAGCHHRAPIMRHSIAPRTTSTLCAEKDHASWRNLAARLGSPETQPLSTDGPGTGSTIRLPVLDFARLPPPDSPVAKKASDAEQTSDARKRTQSNETACLTNLSNKRFRSENAKTSEGSSSKRRSPMGKLRVNQTSERCADAC